MDSPPALPSPMASPAVKATIKKVFSNKAGASNGDDTSSINSGIKGSADSTLERSPSRHSQESSRDGSSVSGSSGIRKLLPGHEKRKRRRQNKETLREGRLNSETLLSAPLPNQSSTSLGDSSSLLTDDSDPEVAPPLLSRDSHAGYLTTSSPLINTTAFDEHTAESQQLEHRASAPDIPVVVTHSADASHRASVPSLPISESTPFLSSESTPSLPSVGLIDRADALKLPETERAGRRSSISKSLRGISPARRWKERFAPSKYDKSPRTSPEREIQAPPEEPLQPVSTRESLTERKRANDPSNRRPVPPAISTDNVSRVTPAGIALPALETSNRPQTPPSATLSTPLTTVTPPTPTEARIQASPDSSPRRATHVPTTGNDGSGVVVSPSGNMISHRRARSQSSLSHQPSKLSNSILAPLTPTIEEAKTPSVGGEKSRNPTPSGGFFSSWVSAAQTAATQLTNTLNNQQNRSRSGTQGSEPEKRPAPEEEPEILETYTVEESPKKQLAVETMGSGDLNLSHLGIDNAEEKPPSPMRPDLEELRKQSSVRRDEAAAKIEDMLAKRAVSAAYDKDPRTPVAEVPDPMNPMKPAPSMSTVMGSENEPNGSIFGSEAGSIKRNNSVRSRIAKRRSRGDSNATGVSAIGAMIGASTATLANPASGPRLTGFAVAPKQRNRAFHQLFRSVPEDDYLIEDYSCALQRDILLAGRIYISEGHICFSSNILGWVTTLVISFEEVVSFEKESTAMVFPNAIAIQTLHARHTFRSLLSREATFDLLIGIWKASHPAAFQKSINGKQMEAEAEANVEKPAGSEAGSEDEEEDEEDDEVYDEDEDEKEAGSLAEPNGSIADSEATEIKTVARKPSNINGITTASVPLSGEVPPGAKAADAAAEASVDFPGTATHAPTDCQDSATHYEKIIKDEIIPAPLGKIFSMTYGPASSVFIQKYLNEECRVLELQFDDKTGLNNEHKTRQYTYIKPLGGSIGPKQTKCITTENMDFFDLDKAVSVTCTTQTPDVPSGNAFSVKTRYCLTWAPNNQTRLQMNCGIEWTAKSWLKGPIEKGANDGQQTYGNDLVKALRAAVTRPRAGTTASKGAKGAKRRRKGEKSPEPESTPEAKKEEDKGLVQMVTVPLGPVFSLLGPLASPYVVIGILVLVLVLQWMRGGAGKGGVGVGYLGYSSADRVAAYEAMWQREESELWEWLEERVGGVHGVVFQGDSGARVRTGQDEKARVKKRKKVLGAKYVEAKLREERMSEREVDEAMRVTRERLSTLQYVVRKRKERRYGEGGGGARAEEAA